MKTVKYKGSCDGMGMEVVIAIENWKLGFSRGWQVVCVEVIGQDCINVFIRAYAVKGDVIHVELQLFLGMLGSGV